MMMMIMMIMVEKNKLNQIFFWVCVLDIKLNKFLNCAHFISFNRNYFFFTFGSLHSNEMMIGHQEQGHKIDECHCHGHENFSFFFYIGPWNILWLIWIISFQLEDTLSDELVFPSIYSFSFNFFYYKKKRFFFFGDDEYDDDVFFFANLSIDYIYWHCGICWFFFLIDQTIELWSINH